MHHLAQCYVRSDLTSFLTWSNFISKHVFATHPNSPLIEIGLEWNRRTKDGDFSTFFLHVFFQPPAQKVWFRSKRPNFFGREKHILFSLETPEILPIYLVSWLFVKLWMYGYGHLLVRIQANAICCSVSFDPFIFKVRESWML